MKFSDMFHQNLPCSFDKIRENPFGWKRLSQPDLESKGQGLSKRAVSEKMCDIGLKKKVVGFSFYLA